jgi:hypothetical protein
MTGTKATRRRWLLRVGAAAAGLVLFFAAYAVFTLGLIYSRGERAGYVQKFSENGATEYFVTAVRVIE